MLILLSQFNYSISIHRSLSRSDNNPKRVASQCAVETEYGYYSMFTRRSGSPLVMANSVCTTQGIGKKNHIFDEAWSDSEFFVAQYYMASDGVYFEGRAIPGVASILACNQVLRSLT